MLREFLQMTADKITFPLNPINYSGEGKKKISIDERNWQSKQARCKSQPQKELGAQEIDDMVGDYDKIYVGSKYNRFL